MIRLQNVTYSVDRGDATARVLDDVTADLPTDRKLGILGREGAGKTVLMRLLAGFLRPQSGEITRGARLSFPVGCEDLFRKSQSPRDNLARVGAPFGDKLEEVVHYVAATTRLGEDLDRPLGELPPDVQARFVYVASYALPFDCYLVDERTGPHDAEFKLACQRMLDERAQAGGIILATRRPGLLQRFCDSAAVLEGGKLVVYDRLDEALRSYRALDPEQAEARSGRLPRVTLFDIKHESV